MNYTIKDPQVEAELWIPGDLQQKAKFGLKETLLFPIGGPGEIQSTTPDYETNLYKGMWLVKYQDGHVEAYTDTVFLQLFMPLKLDQ